MLNTETLLRISKEVGASVSRVEATIKLLDGGAAVPFIARYRKEATGNLSEVRVREIKERQTHYAFLEERRQSVLATIDKQGKLTDELRQEILGVFARTELEDLYLPFKPKRKSKSNFAIERGLGPLAEYIWEQVGTEPVEVVAQRFVTPVEEPPAVVPVEPEPVESLDILPTGGEEALQPETSKPVQPSQPVPLRVVDRSVRSVPEAIEGALCILAERVAENSEYRRQLRELLTTAGVVRARVAVGKESEKTKYEMYYKFEETIAKIPSHRMLAIRRGSRENILSYTIETDRETFVSGLLTRIIKDRTSQFAPYLERAVCNGYDRLMAPSIQNEVRSSLRERSEMEAIRVFEENLRSLLIAAPAGPVGVIGIDPGLKTGCKVAVVDETGRFLKDHTIRTTDPQQDLEAAEKTLLDAIQMHNIRGIAIGNGTGSREAESFARALVAKHGLNVFVVVVSEAGASVYSTSKRAREEFANLDVAVRGAISIARRLQDPLAELVKIEPRSIGVGQYQHDVDQRKLKHSLVGAVESCVNHVGVDLNSASVDLLKYVSGIDEKLAAGIVTYRDQNGALRSRAQLRQIEGFGDRTFEQAAGFLRIKDAEYPLDRTVVHPESYALVERMAASLGIPLTEMIEKPDRINAIDFKLFEEEAGRFTVADIREELLKPGRDPRDNFVVPKFREDVKEVADLKEGMELEGTVTNVTNFGAFVDFGVHQDGLVHISELSHKYIQDARQATKVGDVVKVKVIAVDQAMKRISLSMKALIPKPPRPPRRKKAVVERTAVSGPGSDRRTGPAASSDSGSSAAVDARRPQPPRRDHRSPRPPRDAARPASQVKSVTTPDRSPKPPKPAVEKTTPVLNLSMEEKIKLLQAKFGRVDR